MYPLLWLLWFCMRVAGLMDELEAVADHWVSMGGAA